MSNLSELILLVGRGHPYDGAGLIVQATVSQHMKKGGWIVQHAGQIVYWPQDKLEDAFLMLGIYILAVDEPEGPFGELRARARQAFKPDLDAGDIDTGNQRHIARADLQELYDLNRRLLAESGVKIVALRLGGRGVRFKEGDPMREELVELARRYGLLNFELCETNFGRFFGSFSEDVTEFGG